MSKIVRNFTIIDDENMEPPKEEELLLTSSVIIKAPSIDKNDKEINTKNLFEKKNDEPKLQIFKNTEGVVVGLEVLCTCGEKILIRLDYKL